MTRPAILNTALARLRNERGSVVASVAFGVFTTLILTAVVAAVIASLGTTARMNNQTDVNYGASRLQDAYLNATVHGTAVPAGETCDGIFCQEITASDADGIRTLTLTGRAGDKNQTTRIRTLRQSAPTLMTGYDSLGNPVWAEQADTTPHKFSTVHTRGDTSCGLDTAGAIWCWGANNRGQLGDGTTTARSAPAKILGAATYTALSSGTGTVFCGLAGDGQAWCWGNNDAGQIGNGATGTDALTPVNPSGDHRFTSLTRGPGATCGIDTDKAAWCWGNHPGNGTAAAAVPVKVAGNHEFTALAIGTGSTCGLDTAGKIFCWSSGAPAEVAGGRTYTSVQTGGSDPAIPLFCAVDTGSAAWCWGANGSGQLGDGTTTASTDPVRVAGGHAFKSLTLAGTSVCGITTGDRLYCWGANDRGQLGNGTTTGSPAPVAADPGTAYTALSASTSDGRWFCGLTAAGDAKCWGANSDGQALPGSTADVTSPARVEGFQGLTRFSTGSATACVTDARNEVSCWGRNDSGQTGSGTTAPAAGPGTALRRAFAPTAFTGYEKGGR